MIKIKMIRDKWEEDNDDDGSKRNDHLYNRWKLYNQSMMMRATTKRPPVYLCSVHNHMLVIIFEMVNVEW